MSNKDKEDDRELSQTQQVFIIGSKGIPAKYGGFETFVEKLLEYQVSNKISYHVACIGSEHKHYKYLKGRCFDVKVPNIGPAKAIYYDLAALRYSIGYCKQHTAIKRPIFYILACRIGPFIGYYKKKIEKLGGILYVNPDGHEWKRTKWSMPVRKYWKMSERQMVKSADLLICDSQNIERYIRQEYWYYKPRTIYIAYGATLKCAQLANDDEQFTTWLKCNDLAIKDYFLVVCRLVPENNFKTIIQNFMNSKTTKALVMITNENGTFSRYLNSELSIKEDQRIKFVGTVFDQELLKKIRECAYGYLHGHEVGGTNPTLLEALSSTNLNLLLQVGFNQEVAQDSALYFNKRQGNLARLINKVDVMPESERLEWGVKAKARIAKRYSWEFIVSEYESLFLSMRMADSEEF